MSYVQNCRIYVLKESYYPPNGIHLRMSLASLMKRQFLTHVYDFFSYPYEIFTPEEDRHVFLTSIKNYN